MSTRFNKYSDMKKLVRGIAILKACIRDKRKHPSHRAWKIPVTTVSDLEDAEEFIIKEFQKAAYTAEEKEPNLIKLSPQFDAKGILRVGGRARNAADWTHNHKHPIIIPKQSHLANLIIKDQHEKICHLGYRSTLCAIREAGYWLINGPSTVKSYLRKCLPCKRLRNKPAAQQMGNLPEERLERTAPFTHIGIDAFGPFYVKDRRTENKRWGLVSTCLYSRAIHIEILEEMTTDCLILALRCFMAVRGPVKTIVCDNGTNFVGMRNELSRQLNLTDAKLKSYLQANKIEINHNTPKASHQGGVTERMIRSIRAVLNGMNIRNKIDTKTLRAILFEVANIVNNRPLTGTLIHDVEEGIMTPNRLLTMKGPLLALPPGDFPTINVYSSKRWKVAQAVADKFWKAWKAEYFETIMHRQKWTDVQGNIKVGDIVSVVDENTARNDWKIGRVSNTFPGKDGLVRKIEITLGNRWLDRKGKPIEPPTVLSRPISKVILLLST
ncbi:hypothetical protein EB796_014518 [Bugula neritina]|uniref:Integrase catalytic domain-containing protein n=1 Tax=Bugula neritina TaxID=10212 RepID=A0A7J7JM84_BUGNE|nr:hypothetical protein EB796_014518 [Bugula neritina]